MNKLNKTLSGKFLVLLGIICFVVGYFINGIFGDALRTLGFIVFIFGLIGWNKELKNKKIQL